MTYTLSQRPSLCFSDRIGRISSFCMENGMSPVTKFQESLYTTINIFLILGRNEKPSTE